VYLCDQAGCNEQFEQTPIGKTKWLEHRASHNKPVEPPTRSLSADEIKAMKVEEKKKPEPLKLEYVWRGDCPECGNHVDTLDIDAGQEKGKTLAIAFCSKCRKQLSYRPVEKL
jgi:hypothetical protein